MLAHLIGNMSCNLLILVGLTYLLSLLEVARPGFRTFCLGAPFGLAMGGIASVLMLASFDTSDGLLIDLRSVAIVMSGFLGGPLAAVVATVVATPIRFTLGDANVALVGFAMPAIALLGVAAWALGVAASLRNLLALGLVLALLRPAIILFAQWMGWLDASITYAFLTTTLPITAIFYPLGIVAMGSLLRFEGGRVGKAAGLQSENRVLAGRDARYRAIFESSSVAMMWMEKDGRVLRVNQRMADFLGYSICELENMHYEDLLAPEDREDYFRVRAKQAETGLPPKDRERRYLRKDGTFVWGLRSTAVVHPDTDESVHKFVMVQDITEQRSAEQQIRFQAELLESVEEVVIGTDMAGSIIFWNRFAEKLCGLPAHAVIGRNIMDVLPSIKGQFEPAEISARFEAGESWSGDISLERQNGSSVLLRAASSPVKDESGTPVAIVTVATDITEERRWQLALVEEQRTLAVLNRTAANLNDELDLSALMQAVTDAGAELTGAEFGALFSGKRPQDDHFELYALSGIDRPSFEALPLPIEDGVVGPILNDEQMFRWDDVTKDQKYAEAISELYAAIRRAAHPQLPCGSFAVAFGRGDRRTILRPQRTGSLR